MKSMKFWPIIILFTLSVSSVHAADSLTALIKAGERDAAIELIRLGSNVNELESDGSSALHWAVYKVDIELVELLLSRGAKPNSTNNYGANPLGEAVKTANILLTTMLLEAGADVEGLNQDGQSALMLAVRTGVLEVVELLIKHGANVNAKEEWREQTVLMWAAANAHAEITQLLINNGADVNIRSGTFNWGSQITSEPRAQYRPTGGLTPLLYGARSGCLECVRGILAAGADINKPNPDGITPLMVAIDNLQFDTAEFLLDQGANPHLWDWWGRTALYIAIDMNTYNSRDNTRFAQAVDAGVAVNALDIARSLLEAGVDPEPQLNMHRPSRGGNSGRFTDDLLTSGVTPLIRAANSQDADAVELLLQHGAEVDLPNVMGVTPLIAAAGFGSSRGVLRGTYGEGVEDKASATLGLLLAAGADINARVSDTSSHTARIARSSSMSERQGQTAIFGALSQGWGSVVEFLLDNNADINIVDDFDKTLMDAAMGDAGGRVNRPVEGMADLLNGLKNWDSATEL